MEIADSPNFHRLVDPEKVPGEENKDLFPSSEPFFLANSTGLLARRKISVETKISPFSLLIKKFFQENARKRVFFLNFPVKKKWCFWVFPLFTSIPRGKFFTFSGPTRLENKIIGDNCSF
jgi:hypothetical protein